MGGRRSGSSCRWRGGGCREGGRWSGRFAATRGCGACCGYGTGVREGSPLRTA